MDQSSTERFASPVICHLCNKGIDDDERVVAYGEVTGTTYPLSDTREFYMDDIEPVNDWVVVHYHCFYTTPDKKQKIEKQVIKEQIINSVYVFGSGMVIVFDKNKKQIPKYQGHKSEVMDKIMKDKSKDVEIKYVRT